MRNGKNKALWVLAAASAASIQAISTVNAGDITWVGNGADANWSTGLNWSTSNPPAANDNLIFDNGNNTTNNNDTAAATQYNGITFNPNAGGFTLGGNQITLNGNISDNAPGNMQTINLPMLLNGTRTFTVFGAGTATSGIGSLTVGGVISDGGSSFGLTKTGFGNLILNQANTYTGPTTLSGGTVLLDFNTGTSPTSNIIAATSALNFTGQFSSLIVNGNSATPVSQTFASTTIASNTFAGIGATSSGTVTLTLGNFTRGAHSTVAFSGPATGTITATGLPAISNGILGGWATYGSDWATTSGNQVVAYSGYTDIPGGGSLTNSAATNYRYTTSGTAITLAAAGVTDINSLLYNPSGNGTVTIAAGNTLRLGASGGIYKADAGGGTLTVGTAATGTLTAGGAANTTGELVLGGNESTPDFNAIVVAATIANNGSGAVTLIKTGYSAVQLNASNSYTGGTYINAGRLRANVGNGLGTGPVFVAPGARLSQCRLFCQ